MADEGFVLDKPHEIQAFVLLQIYFKLRMEVNHPNGPKWRDSPMKQAIAIMAANEIECKKRTKKAVLAEYKAFLIENNVLTDKA